MVIIEFTRDAEPQSDFNVTTWYGDLCDEIGIEGNDAYRKVSNSLYVSQARLLIIDQIVDFKELFFRFEGEDIKCGSNAGIYKWPRGFCDHNENLLMRFMEYSRHIYEERKSNRITDGVNKWKV